MADQESIDKFAILLADDEESIRDLLSISLYENFTDQVNVVEVSDGEEAIQYIEKQKVHLCILDMNMPNKGGKDVFLFLKNKEKNLPESEQTRVIILTGDVEGSIDNCRPDLAALGVKHVLSKPFKMDEFITQIRKVLTL